MTARASAQASSRAHGRRTGASRRPRAAALPPEPGREIEECVAGNAGQQAPPQLRQQAENEAVTSDAQRRAEALLGMRKPEQHGLQEEAPARRTGERGELRLQVTPIDDLFTESDARR